jgi:hypothetical protein
VSFCFPSSQENAYHGITKKESMVKKKKFVHVAPLTEEATIYFEDRMFRLHSCIVEKEVDSKMYLSSISGKHSFWINKSGDKNWSILK